MSLQALLFGAAFLAAVASPAPPAQSPAPATFAIASDPQTTLTVSNGAYFVVALASNITTGYGWNFVTAGPARTTVFLGKSYLEYKPPQQVADQPPMVGVGGTDLLLFKATHAGSATLSFAYSRPWEKNVKPVRTALFHIVVK